jgi:hypothetical protein
MSTRREGTQSRDLAPFSRETQHFVDYTKLQQQEAERFKIPLPGEDRNTYTRRQMGSQRYRLAQEFKRLSAKGVSAHEMQIDVYQAGLDRQNHDNYYKSYQRRMEG